MKMYEDHKKTMNLNNKGNTEILNSQRPVSSYHRYNNTENNRIPTQEDDEMKENLKLDEINSYNIIQKLQEHIDMNKTTINDFCDNLNLFLNFDQFKDLFKNINFIINETEAKYLFEIKNPIFKEGYIQISSFENNHNIKFKKYEEELINTSYDIKKMNNQFKQLNNEVSDLINADLYKDFNKNKPQRKILSSNTNKKTTFQSEDYSNISNSKISPLKSKNRLTSAKVNESKTNNLNPSLIIPSPEK